MKKVSSILVLSLIMLFLPVGEALAVCPVCTVAVAGGLGVSRLLGIDDLVTSVWIGGLLVSVSFWSADWLKKKVAQVSRFKYLTLSTFVFWYLLTLLPLWLTNIVGHPFNTFLGIDKILLGTFLGTVVFLAAVWADKKVRAVRGRQLFPYEKIIFPVVALLISSLILFMLTK